MNKHNFYIILLSFPHLLTAHVVTDIKKTHVKTTTGSRTCQFVVHKLYPLGQIQLTPCLFKWSVTETQSCSFIYPLPMTVPAHQQQSWTPVTESLWPVKSKIFTPSSLQKKFADYCFRSPWIYRRVTKCPQKKNVSSTSWPTLKKRREEGIFFNGEWNVRDTTVSQSLQ